MKKLKTTELMVNWIRSQGFNLSGETVIKRTFAGRNQQAAGAWTWKVFDPEWHIQIGGFDPIKDLLKCPTLKVSQEGYCQNDWCVECCCIGRCKGL